MILTDKTIINEMANDKIIIRPFEIKNLGTNSYDLTLSPNLLIYTDKVLDVKKKNEYTTFEIDEAGIVLQPNMLYLASSNEYTETLKHVPIIQGKSSLGRLGLFVHVTAGFGDIGFKGHWTLELVAVQPIRIYPNMKIAQITYLEASQVPYTDYSKKADAKYMNQGSLPKSSEMITTFDMKEGLYEMTIEEFNNDSRIIEKKLIHKHANEEYYHCIIQKGNKLRMAIVKVILYHL